MTLYTKGVHSLNLFTQWIIRLDNLVKIWYTHVRRVENRGPGESYWQGKHDKQ